jgi:hypothetical protein
MTDYTFVAWPSWRYGPDGEAAIFEEGDVIPEGWTEHPNQEKRDEEAEAPDEARPEAVERQEEGLLAEQPKRRGRPPKVHVAEELF